MSKYKELEEKYSYYITFLGWYPNRDLSRRGYIWYYSDKELSRKDIEKIYDLIVRDTNYEEILITNWKRLRNED